MAPSKKTWGARLKHWWQATPRRQKAIDMLFYGPLALVLGLAATILVILGLAGVAGLAAGIVTIGAITAPIWGVVAAAVCCSHCAEFNQAMLL